jgi:uroporphyrinogen-III synthase
VLLFPGMDILPCAESPDTEVAIDRLGEAAWAVFVSVNAVAHGLVAVRRRGAWPAGIRTAAVGNATARALEEAGLGPVLRPTGTEDSEGLLAASGWGDLTGRRVVIFRGQGGRETLATGLRSAGALVSYAEVYRRAAPAADPAPLRLALSAGEISAICAMSGETVHNLFELCGPDSRLALCATPWLVPHARVAETARSLGVLCILESAGSSDDAILSTLSRYFSVRVQ